MGGGKLFYSNANLGWIKICARSNLNNVKFLVLVLIPDVLHTNTIQTRPKASGSSSRFQGGRGNRLRTRQGQGKDKTGTWQGQNRDKIGTKQGQEGRGGECIGGRGGKGQVKLTR